MNFINPFNSHKCIVIISGGSIVKFSISWFGSNYLVLFLFWKGLPEDTQSNLSYLSTPPAWMHSFALQNKGYWWEQQHQEAGAEVTSCYLMAKMPHLAVSYKQHIGKIGIASFLFGGTLQGQRFFVVVFPSFIEMLLKYNICKFKL